MNHFINMSYMNGIMFMSCNMMFNLALLLFYVACKCNGNYINVHSE